MRIDRRLAALESRLGASDADDALDREYREYLARGEEPPRELVSVMMIAAAKRHGLEALIVASWKFGADGEPIQGDDTSGH